ncbi:helix-turn-helix domain-containing protein [Sporosarcina newyorkensis]|uniref:Helix-turn-helix domain-containing protein n=1 Tax=Sporosarcina newyorkensis TaxID=759851 RepID=A0A1T4YHK9_9BACL|nr:helix-turn-helix domain-containing protein [Sporosarcina newyorkensis]SKB01322.1 Helix-turn-helix domain-containing protein [Sporosarcina newyorkensis]
MKLVDYLKKINVGGDIKTAANLGYVYTPNSIRRCLRLGQEEKLLFFEIFSLYNEERKCAFPTQQTLAMYLGVSSSSVSKTLKRLEEKGFIQSFGRKGKKKRYVPLISLHSNPYLILSETFHFATKVINKVIPEEISGDWGNKLLQFVNVNKKDEFTERDPYGLLVINFNENTSTEQFLNLITEHVNQSFSIILEVNWKEEIAENKKRHADRKEGKKKSLSSYQGMKNSSSSSSSLDENAQLQQWMLDMGIED